MNFYQKHILPRFLNQAMKKMSTDEVRSSIAEQASGIVLEIGFGTGMNIPFYKNISKLYALDPSRELYEYAKERIGAAPFPVEFIQASAEKIPLDGHSIDAVVSTWTFCSIPHPEAALTEIKRVLKPGGKFVFIEHGKSPRKFIFKLQNILTPFSKRIAGGCHLNRDIEKMLTDTGFEISKLEKTEQYPRVLSFTYNGVAINSPR